MKLFTLLIFSLLIMLPSSILISQRIEWEYKMNMNPFYRGASLHDIIKKEDDSLYIMGGIHYIPGTDPEYLNHDTIRSLLIKVNKDGITNGLNYFYRKGMLEYLNHLHLNDFGNLEVYTYFSKLFIGGNISPFNLNKYVLNKNGNIIYDHHDSVYIPEYQDAGGFLTFDNQSIGYKSSFYVRSLNIFDSQPEYKRTIIIDTLNASLYSRVSEMKALELKNNGLLIVTRIDSLHTNGLFYYRLMKLDNNFKQKWENYYIEGKNYFINKIIENEFNQFVILGKYVNEPFRQFIWLLDENGSFLKKIELRDSKVSENFDVIKQLKDKGYAIFDRRKEDDEYCMNFIKLDSNFAVLSEFKFNCDNNQKQLIQDFIEENDGAIIACGTYMEYPYYCKIVDIPTSIETKRSTTSFRLGPNPALNHLYANFDSYRLPIRWQVINSIGIVLNDDNISSTQLSLDISAYPAGLYFAVFEYADGTWQVEKFIKIGE